MKSFARWAFVTLSIVAVSSCSTSSRLQFTTGSKAVAVKTTMFRGDADRRTYRLEMAETLKVTASASALRLDVSGSFDSIGLSAGSEDDMQVLAVLRPVPTAAEHSYIVSIPVEKEFDTLSVEVGGPGDSFTINSAGFVANSHEVTLGPVASLDASIGVSVAKGNPHPEYTFTLDGVASVLRAENFITAIELRYDYPWVESLSDAKTGLVSVEALAGGGESVRYRLDTHPGGGEVYLYAATMGFVPDTVRIVSRDESFSPTGLRLVQISESTLDPIPGDLAAILDYDENEWRREDFELFRWSRFPSILVFDTRDYAVQSLMFKRLAFFVEKWGFAGRVLSDEELETRHGWNAHDYRGVDLAEFYNASELAELNSAELELLNTLIKEGIIEAGPTGYRPGDGGILSLSRESIPRLRYLFLVHEAYHGVFFDDQEYRDAVFNVWVSLSDDEREFWRRFLANRFYNPDDEFLVINEFQAYLMQQELPEVDSYFVGYAVPRFKIESPQYVDFADALLTDYPDTFVRSASAIAEAGYRTSGIRAESLFCLVPISN